MLIWENNMVYILCAVGVFALDFLVKRKVDKERKLNVEKEVCNGKIVIRKYYNDGATLNFLAKKPKLMLIIHTMVMAIVAIIYGIVLRKKGNLGLKLGLSFLVGGGLSNLYDRYTKKHVVDYFSFGTKWKKLRNIIFNISDFFIFLGAIMTALFSGK